MKKFRKLLVVLVIMLTISLSSCGVFRLEMAMNRLEKKSFTLDSTMLINMKISYPGISRTLEQVIDMKIETDHINTYTTTTDNGTPEYMYTKVEDDKVQIYEKGSEKWRLVDTQDVSEYSNNMEIVEIDGDVREYFKRKGNKWVGNTEKLSELFEEVLQEYADEFGASGLEITRLAIDKYDITLKGINVSEIEIVISISMAAQGVSLDMSLSMFMNYSDIGSTYVKELRKSQIAR